MIVIAKAEITDPNLVDKRSQDDGLGPSDEGGIYVSCKEMNAIGARNFIYCRYALSIPYQRIQVGQKIWIQPTIIRDDGNSEQRWIYTGYVDAGGEDVGTDDQFIIRVLKFFIKSLSNGKVNQKADGDFTIESLSKITLESPKVFLGSAKATEAAVLGDSLEVRVTNLETISKTHTHATAAPGPPVVGLPTLVTGPGFLSTVVKVK